MKPINALFFATLLSISSWVHAFTVLLPADTTAFLRNGYVSNDSVPIPIQEGLWWNPQEPGSGYSFYLQERVGFVSWYTYESDGKASFYTVQGDVERLGEVARVGLGYALVLRGPLLRSRDGQVLDGAWRAPIAEDAGLGTAEFRFIDSRRAELRLARGGSTRTAKLQPFDPGGIPEADLLIGRWVIAWRYQPGETTLALVEISADRTFEPNFNAQERGLVGTPNSPVSLRFCDGPKTTSLPDNLRPPSDAKYFQVRCVEGCVPLPTAPIDVVPPGLQSYASGSISLSLSRHLPQWHLWYSPSTRQFGNLSAFFTTFYSCSDPADLFVTRDRIVARGRRVVPFGNNTVPFHHTEFVMSRLPAESFDRYLIPTP